MIATFNHSKKIEIALADLQNSGLDKSKILVLPLDNKENSLQLFDSKNKSDRESLIDIAAILGMILMLLGSIYGFILKWGPIIWALIGLIIGIIVGLGIKFIFIWTNKKASLKENNVMSQVIVLVNCDDHQGDQIKQILWRNDALGLTTYFN